MKDQSRREIDQGGKALEKRKVLSFFLNDDSDVAERTFSGISFHKVGP
jgi:hypothetical protein